MRFIGRCRGGSRVRGGGCGVWVEGLLLDRAAVVLLDGAGFGAGGGRVGVGGSVARLVVAGGLLAVDPDPAVDAAGLLDVLVSSVAAVPGDDRIWLLLTAVGASFPTRGEVDAVRRALELSDRTGAVVAVLDAGLAAVGDPDAVIDVVRGGVLVDV